MFLAIYKDLEVFKGLDGFLKGLLISVIAMVIVFLILLLICLLVNLLKVIGGAAKKEEKVENDFIKASPEKKAFSESDIKDDDMMAAILVATIDYVSETKEDARVVSAKQIG